MDKPIYFSKVEYQTRVGYGEVSNVLLLDIEKQELSYQVFHYHRQMPSVQGIVSEEWNGNNYTYDVSSPARIARNANTNFKPQLLKSDQYEKEVVFSYGIKISDAQMKELLPYCNALDFEPYRAKEMSMDDPGFIGYRDEIRVDFTGITNSYIPKLELPMSYFYDEEHIWPSEKLYRYLMKTFLENKKKLKGWIYSYGDLSLFFQ
ncbi:MAG: hypothetical protein PHY47_24320 [Lachnospiraceae bacterium]|nr:hypothetical protein [Lachnospiraceae bacterium]